MPGEPACATTARAGVPVTPGRDEPAAERAERRRRLDEVFGDDLPDRTRDEVDLASESDPERDEEWLRRQVPPHHG